MSMTDPTPSFICEFPLRAAPWDIRILNVRLDHAARQVYNACLGEALRRVDRLRQHRVYQCARRLPKSRLRTSMFATARGAVEFTEAALHRYAVRLRQRAFREHLDVHVVQTLATRAFDAVNAYAVGRRGRPRFKGARQLDTVEGKSNHAEIRWRDEHVEWRGLRVPAIIKRDDPVVAHALACRIKYVRLVRRKRGARTRFFAQLVCAGRPYRKPEHVIGQGEVGLDIGPSTVAAVTAESALLVPFCDEVVRHHRGIRRLQRHRERQRRANNPDHYLPDGQTRPGPKRWVISLRERQTLDGLAELHRREAAHRKTLHGQLANRVLTMGRVIKLEKITYRSYQRRFGRSVSLCAPGTFVAILRRKAAREAAV